MHMRLRRVTALILLAASLVTPMVVMGDLTSGVTLLALFLALDYFTPSAAALMGLDPTRSLMATLVTGLTMYASLVSGLPSLEGFSSVAKLLVATRRLSRYSDISILSVLILGILGAGLLAWLFGARARTHIVIIALFASLCIAQSIAASIFVR